MPRSWPELFILRHGETEWNAEGRMQGGLDSPLTARGRAQARAQGAALLAAGVTGTTHALWSSPQGRARDTAFILRVALAAEHMSPPRLRTDARLREIGQGGWEGRTRPEIAQRWPGSQEGGDPFLAYDAAPGGEGFIAIRARAEAFLLELDGPAVIVTHGITSRFLRGVVLGLATSGLGQLPGGQGVVYHLRDGEVRTLGD